MAPLVPTNRLTSNLDNDRRQDDRYPVARKNPITITESTSGTATSAQQQASQKLTGKLVGCIVSSPNVPTDTTITITVIDTETESASNTEIVLGTSDAISDNGISYANMDSKDIYLYGKPTFRINWATAYDAATDPISFDLVPIIITP